jgi:hypothetical protein
MSEKDGDGRGLSERDRFWLEHHEAQVASGQTGKEYVAEHDLSLHAPRRGTERAQGRTRRSDRRHRSRDGRAIHGSRAPSECALSSCRLLLFDLR